jgi:hypothetical protein
MVPAEYEENFPEVFLWGKRDFVGSLIKCFVKLWSEIVVREF